MTIIRKAVASLGEAGGVRPDDTIQGGDTRIIFCGWI